MMRHVRSLRFRVTIVAMATTAVLVVAFGWLLTELVSNDLVEAGEGTLEDLTVDVEGVALVRLGEEGAEFEVEREGVVAMIDLDDDGDIVAELFREDDGDVGDEPIGEFVLDTGTEEIRSIENLDESLTDAELRRISEEVAEDVVDGADGATDNLGLIRATQDVLADVSDGVDAARRAAWRIGPLVVLLSGLVTWLVVGRALGPTRRIAVEAENVGPEHLDRRISRTGDGAEVDTIARVINEMLDRIEDGVRREQQFVADASHELRTPLATTRMAAELAGADAPESPYPPQVLEEVDRMQAMVDDLLELAHDPGERQVERVRLDEVIADVVDGHPSRSRLATSAASDVVVEGRAIELRRVVVNLVDNAVHFAPGEVRVALEAVGRTAVITVDDDGPGIAPADRRRVFDRFARLDEGRGRREGGSGLGLAIVKAIVDRHDGAVAVTDSPAGGARFTVTLPLADSAVDRSVATR